MIRVKICGITSLEDGLAAAQAGADLLGFNFYAQSPRYIAPASARVVCAQLRDELGADCPTLVGLFVNEPVGTVSAMMERVGLRAVQLSGDESVDMLHELRGTAYRAIRPRSVEEVCEEITYFSPGFTNNEQLPSLLIDAHQAGLYGGTGVLAAAEIARAASAMTPRLMLAGGLKPDNVGAIAADIQPWAVDVASGVEIDGQPGRKHAAKMIDFVAAVRQIEMG